MTSAQITLMVLGVAGLGVAFAGLRRWARSRRRARLMAGEAPDSWAGLLERNVPLYRRLPDKEKRKLHGLMAVFLDEKTFEGCGGLEVTEEMKVTVAAQACMLVLNNRYAFYGKLRSILLYPAAYRAGEARLFSAERAPGSDVRLGESWESGSVVLAWDHVRHGAHDFRDGENVVLHEFAHQIDQADGDADGAPDLGQRSRYSTWARAFGEAYERLQKRTRAGKRTVMDEYGATDPAEFFAVATETFFEKPRQLQEKYPDLYQELQAFYGLDPVAWREESS